MQSGPSPLSDNDKSDWRGAALCASLSPQQADELFFIGPGKKSKRAQLFCTTCPVKRECANFAVMYNEYGIWAGTTEDDRQSLDPFIREQLRSEAAAQGRLESRNTEDFLTGYVTQLLDATQQALEDVAQLVEQLEVPVHPFEQTNAPQGIAL